MVRSVLSLALVAWVSGSPLEASKVWRGSAWEELARKSPGVVDDTGVSWLERLALHVLTPEQGRAYLRGASPDSLVLEDGQTLAEYLRERMNPPGGLYVALPGGCELFSSEYLIAKGEQTVKVQEQCGIPEEATALLVTLRAESPNPLRVKLWAADLPEPAEAVWESSGTTAEEGQSVMVVVGLCEEEDCSEGDLALRATESAILLGRAVGYFRALRTDDAPGRALPLATESTVGTYNDFFGYNAGGHATGNYNAFFGRQAGFGATTGSNNTGDGNSYFGAQSGYYNTTGSHNAFFGYQAGSDNTSGYSNVFMGQSAGTLNTSGHDNTFVGRWAGFLNATGSDNAYFGSEAGAVADGGSNVLVGYQAGYGATPSTYNTGFNNSYVGYQAGYSNTDGSANAFFGGQAGYKNTSGSNGTFAGHSAGFSNTSGSYNAFFGGQAGYKNTSGSHGTFAGHSAGFSNTSGNYNAYFGKDAGYLNQAGEHNAFFGTAAGYNNTASENSFFGSYAGVTNVGGTANAFFGRSAGYFNTASSNSFFGYAAGLNNSTGSSNAFFGRESGKANTVEGENTFVGPYADLAPGIDPVRDPVTNATAVGHRAFVSQSNSLVLGSIAGVNGATDSVRVGIGTSAPSQTLHLFRNDGTAQILVEDQAVVSAVRTQFHLKNNGAPRFAIANTSSGVEWSFQQSGTGSFLISKEGTGGPEMQVFQNGRVRMGPGGAKRFDLAPNGDLAIAGSLTANGSIFPDYVFEPDYPLLALTDLRTFIQKKRRLPGIPSAEDVKRQGGHNMTELQIKLLEKIEELTLYTLEQEKRLLEIEQDRNLMKAKLTAIEALLGNR